MNRSFLLVSLVAICTIFATNVLSCNKADVVVISIGNDGLSNELIENLEISNIWYSLNDDKDILVQKASAEEVNQILNRLNERYIPSTRSRSFEDGMHNKVVESLKKAGISYEIVYAYDTRWVVWLDKDVNRVENIIMDVAFKMRDSP